MNSNDLEKNTIINENFKNWNKFKVDKIKYSKLNINIDETITLG